MKNHIVAPNVVARNLYLNPGRCGLKPVPESALETVSSKPGMMRRRAHWSDRPWWRESEDVFVSVDACSRVVPAGDSWALLA